MKYSVGKFVLLLLYVISLAVLSMGAPLVVVSMQSGLNVSAAAIGVVALSLFAVIIAAKKCIETAPFSALLPLATCSLFFLDKVILTGPVVLAGSVFVSYFLSKRIHRNLLNRQK